MNICKTCKTHRNLVRTQYYLGTKSIWECKCGRRMVKREDIQWYNMTQEEREERGID